MCVCVCVRARTCISVGGGFIACRPGGWDMRFDFGVADGRMLLEGIWSTFVCVCVCACVCVLAVCVCVLMGV